MIILGKAILILFNIFYPLLWYFGREQGWFIPLATCMAVLWFFRAIKQIEKSQRKLSFLIAIFFIVVAYLNTPTIMYWYPVLINLLMLSIFTYSLYQPQSLIEKIARLQNPKLPSHAIIYTRHVTQIWCLFFIINACISALLVVLNWYQAWAIYTGIIAYILMGILLGAEWLYRQRAMK